MAAAATARGPAPTSTTGRCGSNIPGPEILVLLRNGAHPARYAAVLTVPWLNAVVEMYIEQFESRASSTCGCRVRNSRCRFKPARKPVAGTRVELIRRHPPTASIVAIVRRQPPSEGCACLPASESGNEVTLMYEKTRTKAATGFLSLAGRCLSS